MSLQFQEDLIDREDFQEPDVFDGQVEILILPPFNYAHVIHCTRELEKCGCKFHWSSGSLREGCLIRVSVEEPCLLLNVLAGLPGAKEASLSSAMGNDGAGSQAQVEAVPLSGHGDVPRIVVAMEPPAEQTVDSPKKEFGAHHAEASPDIIAKTFNHLWSRRLTYDARHSVGR